MRLILNKHPPTGDRYIARSNEMKLIVNIMKIGLIVSQTCPSKLIMLDLMKEGLIVLQTCPSKLIMLDLMK